MSSALTNLVWRVIWPSWEAEEWPRVRRQFETAPPGAVTLFARHLPDLERACHLNADILRLSDGATRIAVDQEGGPVQRLPEPAPRFPAAAFWRERSLPAAEIATGYRRLAELLRLLGFSIDFAPVADLAFDEQHPALRRRCFAAPGDPEAAARVAAAARGLRAGGVEACVKHFPGHGAVAADSHLELDTLNADLDTVREREWPPFRAAFEAGARMAMVGHFRWPALDDTLPTTFSRRLIERLRSELAFDGVIVSDDLGMGAISNRWPPDEAALLALTAGQDAVLFCHRFEVAEQAAECCIREAERSPAFREMLRAAAARIARLGQVPGGALPKLRAVDDWLRSHPAPWPLEPA